MGRDSSRLGKGVVVGLCWGLGRSGGAVNHPRACFLVWENVVLDSTGSFAVIRLCQPDGFYSLSCCRGELDGLDLL